MKDEGNKTNIKLLLQALVVGIFTGIVVGLFRFGIEKTSGFWLHLFQLAHSNPLWFIVIIIGFIAVAVIAGYFVKQYPHVGGSGIPEVKLQLQGKDRKSTRLNSSHVAISYAVFCLKKNKMNIL